jgi:hypothetical protein
MAEERQMAAVSRSEFYTILMVTWLYLFLMAINQFREQGTLSTTILFLGALLMFFSFAVQVFNLEYGKREGA